MLENIHPFFGVLGVIGLGFIILMAFVDHDTGENEEHQDSIEILD